MRRSVTYAIAMLALGVIPATAQNKPNPGVPRAAYMPFPFQIIQEQKDILIAYEFASVNRLINMGKPQEAVTDTAGMGRSPSNGHLSDASSEYNELRGDDRRSEDLQPALEINVILYRHREKDARLLEFKCVEFTEELIYGDLRKKGGK